MTARPVPSTLNPTFSARATKRGRHDHQALHRRRVRLASLRAEAVTNPGARWVTKPGHQQQNFQVTGLEDEAARFAVCLRQNEQDAPL